MLVFQPKEMTMKRLACVLALAAAFASNDALAWGNDGHRAVGAIADKLIKGTNAQKELAKLLLPGESLESIATWADCIKGTYCGPQTPEMISYVAANPLHIEYHYTDVPFQSAAYQDGGVGTTDHDIVQTLQQAIAALRGKTDPVSNPHGFTKREALMLITHLAGDIHQPLHVGAAYLGKDNQFVVPEKTAQIDAVNLFDAHGGNNLMLDDQKLTTNSATLIPPPLNPKVAAPDAQKALTKPFHSYWDTTVVDYVMRRVGAKTPEQFAQIAIDSKPVVALNTGDVSTWPKQWANDDLQMSKLAYADVIAGKSTVQKSRKGDATYLTWSVEVPQNYAVPSSALAKSQMIKGGYHLASLLESIWP